MATITHRLIMISNWKQETTTLEKCAGCEEVIYSPMYRLHLTPKNERLRHKFKTQTDMVVCQSCMDLINSKQNEK